LLEEAKAKPLHTQASKLLQEIEQKAMQRLRTPNNCKKRDTYLKRSRP